MLWDLAHRLMSPNRDRAGMNTEQPKASCQTGVYHLKEEVEAFKHKGNEKLSALIQHVLVHLFPRLGAGLPLEHAIID